MTSKGNMRNIKVGRLQERFIDLCWKWMAANRSDKTALGKHLGFPHARISELLNKTRCLTMYYVDRFVKKGVFMVDDLYDGVPESEEEREAWDYLKLCEDKELLFTIIQAQRGGLKRELLLQILRSHIKDEN